MLRESAAQFLDGRDFAAAARGAIGQRRAIDRSVWREMADLGWLALALPESLGGSGLGIAEQAVLSELFGSHVFPEPYVAASVLPCAVLAACTDETGTGLARACGEGTRLFALAWQEAAGQIDPPVPETRLASGRVHGRKRFVAAAEDDGVLLVSARTDDTPCIVAVAADAPGVRMAHHATGLGSGADVDFRDAPILGGAPLLAGTAATVALHAALAAGRAALAAQLLGLAAGALDRTLQWVGMRKQFDRAIGSFQTIQHRCVDLRIAVELSAASLRNAIHALERAPGTAATNAAISAAKARCGDTATLVGRSAVQMHGAIGFTEDAPIGVYLRMAMSAAGWLGGAVDHRRRLLAASRQGAAHHA